ncbi:MAG: hypothetical protein RMI51_05145 [Aquificaceae bacterium]|nr:hypothetical protein [Aquificaceae bacterium]
MNFTGYIQRGLYYKQIIAENLKEITIEELEISGLSKFIVRVKSDYMAVCKWVSPKRTRSYPYARVYDILSQHTSKKVAIIPVIKDEGKAGDRDFLQWDTVAMLSLLGVYAIPAYYCWAMYLTYNMSNKYVE